MDVAIAILSSTALASLITKLGDYLIARKKKKTGDEDAHDKKIDALVEGVKYLLLSDIKEQAYQYIEANEVSYRDKELLNKAHAVYHTGLGGNGDLDKLIVLVDALPLKLSDD